MESRGFYCVKIWTMRHVVHDQVNTLSLGRKTNELFSREYEASAAQVNIVVGQPIKVQLISTSVNLCCYKRQIVESCERRR